jgi:hypothetical protein
VLYWHLGFAARINKWRNRSRTGGVALTDIGLDDYALIDEW